LANIGETALSTVALNLEHAGRNGDIAAMIAGTTSFLTSLQTVIERIKPKDKNGKVSNVDWDDVWKAHLYEKLLIIQSACMTYDERIANTTLIELRQKTWPSQVRELLAAIAERLLHSEFEEAAALATDYVNNRITSDTA